MPAGPEPLLRHIRRLAARTASDPASDAALLERFLASGDEAAFTAIAGRHAAMVLRVCRGVLGDAHAAEDACQAAFLVLARKAASVRPRHALAAWLHGVARRVALKARAGSARRPREVSLPAAPLADPRPDPLAELSARELLAVLDEEIGRLPEVYRLPVILCCLEGRTQEEAARQLGWTPGSVKGRLERGRARLHDRLTRRGLTLSAALAAVEISRGAAGAGMVLVAPMVRAAVAFAGKQGVAAGGVSAEVVALAEEAARGLAASQMKALTALVLAASVAAAGVGVLAHQTLAVKQPEARQEPAPKPAAKTVEQPTQPEARQARTDRYGDALPPGAVARLGTARLWQGSPMITVLVYAPDGKTVAACAYDSIIRLWDTTTGKQVRQFQGQSLGISAVAFSPDGKLLASAGWGDLLVWRLDRTSDKEIRRIPAAKGGSEGIAFSPDGKLLATATKDHAIRLWAVDSWREVRQFVGQGGGGLGFNPSLAFFPDGKTLASASQDNTIRLWDVATGKQRRLLAKNLTSLWTAALSPDGKRLAAVDGRTTLLLWDTATGQQISRLTGPDFYCIAFSSDSRTLAASSGQGGEVCFWDTATGKERRKWTSPQRQVSRLAFAPNGKVLAVGASPMIHFRDAATGKDLLPLPGHAEIVTTVAFAPDGKTLLSASQDGVLGFWEPATGKALAPLKPPPRGVARNATFIHPIALSHDCRRAAAVDAHGVLQMWDAASGKALSRFGQARVLDGRVAFSPDGQLLALAHWDGMVRLWDTATGKQIRRVGFLGDGYMPTFSPDGKVLATRSLSSSIWLWDTTTGKLLRTLRWQSGSAGCLAFSPDGKSLAAGQIGLARDHRGLPRVGAPHVRVWDLTTGREMLRLQGTSEGWVDAAAFSPDGRTLAAGSTTIYLWEVASGRERRSFQGHGSSVGALAFSPDGRLLASGSYDHTGLVWDVTGLAEEGKPRAGSRPLPKLASLWDDLAGADAPRAYQAVWRLATTPEQTIPFLKAHLRPAPVLGPDRLAQLIADLNSDRFAVREQAAAELAQAGTTAEPALRRALAGRPSPEVRRRAERLLDRLHEPAPPGGQLQALRAVEVLEHAGTPEARQVLAALARGAAHARLTQEARASLERLARRAVAVP